MNSNDPIVYTNNLKDEQNTVMTCNEIINYIKCFNGDIYGAFVRDWRILGKIFDNFTIDTRLEPSYSTIFINILSFKYKVRVLKYGDLMNDGYITKLTISPIDPRLYNFQSIDVNIILVPKCRFHHQKCDFDVNLFAENTNSLYIYKNELPGNLSISDKFTHIKQRICNHTFCLLNKSSLIFTLPNQYTRLIEITKEMLKKGWLMDDLILEENSWIISTWFDLMVKRSRKRPMLENCRECSLCQEEFNNNDIVINTTCNHNFHWECKSSTGGLKKWVGDNQQITCPICRSVMF